MNDLRLNFYFVCGLNMYKNVKKQFKYYLGLNSALLLKKSRVLRCNLDSH